MYKYSLLFLTVFIGISSRGSAQYNEKYRPQYHLSAKASSMADPKGLFIWDSTFHIYWFGQWEHAVSNDLIHWRELPKPMKGAPSQFSYFSGSVVVDKQNTAGFGENSAIAVYTRHFPGDSLPESQSISVSHDGGNTYQYYDKNPVLDINSKSFRDPQVFWYKPTKRWVMVVASSNQQQIPIYTSPDLKNWTSESVFGKIGATGAAWECPDLIELPVVGEKGKKKWIMIIGRGPNKVEYFVGDFDGHQFKPDPAIEEYLRNGKGLAGKVFEDFEAGVGNWNVQGDLFETDSSGSKVKDYLGHSYAGSIQEIEKTGKAKSKDFTINSNAINFLLAGGRNADSLSFRLIVDGKIMRTITGDDTKVFRWNGWDVRELKGKKAYLELIDLQQRSPNGGIGVDHIVFSDGLMNTQSEHALWLDYGEDFYATRTWRNYDEKKHLGDTVLLMSWMGNWRYARISPTSWGSGFQTVPRVVSLNKFPEGLRVTQEPINALKSLRKDSICIREKVINGTIPIPGFQPTKNSYEIEAEFDTQSGYSFGFNLLVGEGRKAVLKYDPQTSILSFDRTNCTDYVSDPEFTKRFATVMNAPVETINGKIRLRLFVDESSIEVFANDGKVVISAVTYPSPLQTGVEVFSEGGITRLKKLNSYILNSIW
jgi:fructan beta-fructosidase